VISTGAGLCTPGGSTVAGAIQPGIRRAAPAARRPSMLAPAGEEAKTQY